MNYIKLIKKIADIANSLDNKGVYDIATNIDSILVCLAMSYDQAAFILEVPTDASKEEILSAYKQKALKYHPDRGGNLEKMKELNVAKTVMLGSITPPLNQYEQTNNQNNNSRVNPIERAQELFDKNPIDFISSGLVVVWPNIAYQYILDKYIGNAKDSGFFKYGLYKIQEYSHLENDAAEMIKNNVPQYFFYKTPDGKILRERHADKIREAAEKLFKKDISYFAALVANGMIDKDMEKEFCDKESIYYVIRDNPRRFFESDWTSQTLRDKFPDKLLEAAISFYNTDRIYFEEIMPRNFADIYNKITSKGQNVDIYAKKQMENLYKEAYHLDQQELYDEASKIEDAIRVLVKRVGLIDADNMISLANYFDSIGDIETANLFDKMLKKEAKKKKKSMKPPKKWWYKMVKEIKNENPDYSEERISKTIGDIWFNNLKEKKRKEIRNRYN